MRFNPKELLVLVGFGVLRATASSADGGAWSHFADARTTVATLLGVVRNPLIGELSEMSW